ncbi:ATP-dependent RNA helicase [Tieghemostelium lacteum]|uniref:ATP-dependent RNA helicase n=1 Tax=Tieghemostelium lacteum TaxID=361077 RepID=A0A151ZF94_TIELA|nr:ATP-dependent RNA helicase [Tieghemostelium lacteum]|eukprot:KYQ92605.1 ATP-dependent RNA helicase [Tieghemostelium lacteum]
MTNPFNYSIQKYLLDKNQNSNNNNNNNSSGNNPTLQPPQQQTFGARFSLAKQNQTLPISPYHVQSPYKAPPQPQIRNPFGNGIVYNQTAKLTSTGAKKQDVIPPSPVSTVIVTPPKNTINRHINIINGNSPLNSPFKPIQPTDPSFIPPLPTNNNNTNNNNVNTDNQDTNDLNIDNIEFDIDINDLEVNNNQQNVHTTNTTNNNNNNNNTSNITTPKSSRSSYTTKPVNASVHRYSEFLPEGFLFPDTEKAIDYDAEAIKTFYYPRSDDFKVREYQMSIIKTCFLQNTFVCLPTSLGKTFIASVVMLNFFRWFPKSKIVFLAHTRGLTNQQIGAFCKYTGISRDQCVMFTGDTIKPSQRAEYWRKKRIFFLTPQILHNDAQSGKCDASQIRCVIADEAHHVSGKSDYCLSLKEVASQTRFFRIVALSASPGSTDKAIQECINNLLISEMVVKTENSADVKEYVHKKSVDKVLVKLSDPIQKIVRLFPKLCQDPLEYLHKQGCINSPLFENNSQKALKALQTSLTLRQNANIGGAGNFVTITHCNNLSNLYMVYKYLVSHGLSIFFKKIQAIQDEPKNNQMKKLLKSGYWGSIYSETQKLINEGVYHDKLVELGKILIEHFKENGTDSRVMVFSSWVDSVAEISDYLDYIAEEIPHVTHKKFVGKTNSSSKIQQKTLEDFVGGLCNVLIATCIGEEGLDIGEVDLVICYDVQQSPIRNIQRTGRTGRKKDGRCLYIIAETYEELSFDISQNKVNSLEKSAKNYLYHFSERMIPDNINPVVHYQTITEIPDNLDFEGDPTCSPFDAILIKKRKSTNNSTTTTTTKGDIHFDLDDCKNLQKKGFKPIDQYNQVNIDFSKCLSKNNLLNSQLSYHKHVQNSFTTKLMIQTLQHCQNNQLNQTSNIIKSPNIDNIINFSIKDLKSNSNNNSNQKIDNNYKVKSKEPIADDNDIYLDLMEYDVPIPSSYRSKITDYIQPKSTTTTSKIASTPPTITEKPKDINNVLASPTKVIQPTKPTTTSIRKSKETIDMKKQSTYPITDTEYLQLTKFLPFVDLRIRKPKKKCYYYIPPPPVFTFSPSDDYSPLINNNNNNSNVNSSISFNINNISSISIGNNQTSTTVMEIDSISPVKPVVNPSTTILNDSKIDFDFSSIDDSVIISNSISKVSVVQQQPEQQQPPQAQEQESINNNDKFDNTPQNNNLPSSISNKTNSTSKSRISNNEDEDILDISFHSQTVKTYRLVKGIEKALKSTENYNNNISTNKKRYTSILEDSDSEVEHRVEPVKKKLKISKHSSESRKKNFSAQIKKKISKSKRNGDYNKFIESEAEDSDDGGDDEEDDQEYDYDDSFICDDDEDHNSSLNSSSLDEKYKKKKSRRNMGMYMQSLLSQNPIFTSGKHNNGFKLKYNDVHLHNQDYDTDQTLDDLLDDEHIMNADEALEDNRPLDEIEDDTFTQNK